MKEIIKKEKRIGMNMKRILSVVLAVVMVLTLIPLSCINVYASGTQGPANIPGSQDVDDCWNKHICCEENNVNVTKTPEIVLTFSEDGTKLLKIETSGYYTSARTSASEWFGMGFGIDETGTDYSFRYLFKDRSECASDNTTAANYLNDAYVLYSFTSKNCYDYNSSFSSVYLNANKGNIKNLSCSYELSDEDNGKLNPNTTYYANFILQGWSGKDAQWGTVAGKKSFIINENSNYRYSANFDYQGGGTNFTLPVKKNESVSSTAVTTNTDFSNWSDTQKNAVSNWSTVVNAPTRINYTFGGWYTDSSCTDGKEADFSTGITDNITYYAKWTLLSLDKKVYISSSGNDTTGNGTLTNPYATLSKAYGEITSVGTIALLSDITVNSGDSQFVVGDNKKITVTSAKADGTLLSNEANNYEGVYTIHRGTATNSLMVLKMGELALQQVILDGGSKNFTYTAESCGSHTQSGYLVNVIGDSDLNYTTTDTGTAKFTLDTNSILQNNWNHYGQSGNAWGGAMIVSYLDNSHNAAPNPNNVEAYILSNAKIRGNIAPRHGGAFTQYTGKVHIQDTAEITNNGIAFAAGNTNGYFGGGAILVYTSPNYSNTADLYISGNASIYDNYVDLGNQSLSSGSVCAVQFNNKAKGYFSGSVRIFDNYSKNVAGMENFTQGNIYDNTTSNDALKIKGALGTNAKIGVTIANASAGTKVAEGAEYTVVENDGKGFFDDRNVYSVIKSSGNNYLVYGSAVQNVSITSAALTSAKMEVILDTDISSVDGNDVSLFKNGSLVDKTKYSVSYDAENKKVTITFSGLEVVDQDKIGIQINKNGYKVNSGKVYEKKYENRGIELSDPVAVSTINFDSYPSKYKTVSSNKIIVKDDGTTATKDDITIASADSAKYEVISLKYDEDNSLIVAQVRPKTGYEFADGKNTHYIANVIGFDPYYVDDVESTGEQVYVVQPNDGLGSISQFKSFGVCVDMDLQVGDIVFGWAPTEYSSTPTHTHTWNYTAEGAKLTAKCTGDDDCTVTNGKTYGVSLTLSATSPTYSGSAVTATYGEGETTAWEATVGSSAPTITYEKKTESNTWTAIESAPINVGEYRAVAKFTNASTDYIAYKEFSITSASISSVSYTEPSVVATGTPATATSLAIASDAKYTGAISWSPADTSFGYNKTYTAAVTLSAKDNYVFASDVTIPTGWTRDTTNSTTATLVLTKTFDATGKAKITSITAPSVTSPRTSFTTEVAQLAALPTTVTVAVEDSSVTSMPITWTLKSGTTYSTVSEAENVFVWTITASAYANFDKNGKSLTGEVTIKNPTHAHDWKYTADGAKLTAKCDGDGDCSVVYGKTDGLSLTLTATTTIYSGSAYTGASIDTTQKTAWEAAGITAPTIQYVGNASTTYSQSETAPTNAGTYTATITVGDKTASVDFTIAKANVATPTVSKSNNETISGKNDGKMSGLTTAMEYRLTDVSDYSSVTAADMTFAPGTYKVRYKENANHNASPDTEVVILAGSKLTVTLPSVQTGYTITVDTTENDWHDSPVLTYKLKLGYSETDAFKVKVNGQEVTLVASAETKTYTLPAMEEDVTVTVEGVVDITKPTGEISIETNGWTSLLNTITFGKFFKETKNVTITGADAGSGIAAIKYYISESALTEEAVTALAETDWTTYTSFSIAPNKKCVIYAKISDNSGNVTYISSDGLIFENGAPVIAGITSGTTYCHNVEFTVTDTYLDTVKANDTVLIAVDGKYTLPSYGVTYNVVATDKAGNSTTITSVTAKNGHAYSATWSKDATYHWHAAICSHTSEISDKAAHTYGNWSSNNDATTSADGTKSRTCSICGYKQTVTDAGSKIENTGSGDNHENGGDRDKPASNENGGSNDKPVSNNNGGDNNKPASNENGGNNDKPVSNNNGGDNNKPASNNNDEDTNQSVKFESEISEEYADLLSDSDKQSGITMEDIKKINEQSEVGDKGIAPIVYSEEQIEEARVNALVVEEEKIANTIITEDTVVKVGEGSVLIIIDSVDKNHDREGEVITGFVATNAENVLQACLTKDERELVALGENVTIRVLITNVEDKVPEDDAKQIEEETNKLSKSIKGLNLGEYVDITLQKQIGDSDWQRLKELDEELEVSFDVPKILKAKGRTYLVMRDHEGVCKLLYDLDENQDSITIRTHLFSTYAVLYTDEEVDFNSLAEGSCNWHFFILALTIIALLGIWLIRRKNLKISIGIVAGDIVLAIIFTVLGTCIIDVIMLIGNIVLCGGSFAMQLKRK